MTPVKNLFIGSCWAVQIGGLPVPSQRLICVPEKSGNGYPWRINKNEYYAYLTG
ncbi:MAG: hypothetical protein GXZ07_00930 [Firmicutes bacterium]|nr:hypothetical protein [Bacillota bacterium]